MKRILVVNDYSLTKSWRDTREGLSPRHLLYAVDYLEKWGHEIIDISEDHSRLLAALDRKLRRSPLPLGSAARQLAALPFLSKIDVIYSPCQTQINTLCYLRAAGLLKVPIVCLAHHPIDVGRLAQVRRPLWQFMMRGMAAFPAISSAVSDQINELAPGRQLSEPLVWGPDPDFYPPPQYPGTGVIAPGRTGRDFVCFARAAARAGTPATILCPDAVARRHAAEFAHPNVHVIEQPVFLEYCDAVKLFAGSRALAVPMVEQRGLCGLSTIMDALGAGKPLIVTRNPLIDLLDVEALGIGRWVAPGDEDGWVDALRFFEDHPGEAEAMGRRARALVDSGAMHAGSFAEKVHRIILEACDHNEQTPSNASTRTL